MKDYSADIEKRVQFIKEMVAQTNAQGIVFGNSGGKDCALVGILCKMAVADTVSVMMPCSSQQNYASDLEDAQALVEKFKIEARIVDLKEIRDSFAAKLSEHTTLTRLSEANISPRIRMTTLYAIAGSENRLVAGTGNKSERTIGYFTKWGDGACDFNPIADLTVTEIFEYLRYLGAPENIINKAPSAGLFDGQTDEQELQISYATIDDYINGKEIDEVAKTKIDRLYKNSEHKRKMPPCFK